GEDVLRNYQRANPMELVWPDRRPIGKTFLASMGVGEPDWDRNPNQWFMNAKDFDIRTEEGKEEFRTRVLKMADAAVAMAKAQNAQGIITWDIEGQRQGHVYYGDPRQMGAIAPEMEYKGEHEDAVADAYFKRFKEAGVRYGVCVRPQRLYQTEGEPPTGGWWVQDEVTREEALELLISKIDYAVKRWGVTLVYIDSDYAVTSHDYKTLFKRFPGVLLVPEWKKPLHYAYTAPLHSYFHFKNTGTPAMVRKIFSSKAFCVNFVDGIAASPDREALLASLKDGDVPCVNSWYGNADITLLGELYKK
ncbi:MAG: hypothetical protein FWF84_03370, partial [Kiritimatiellaeota bacterium]|nr:hypothetical protein [Kiritimatiellota bacterium]